MFVVKKNQVSAYLMCNLVVINVYIPPEIFIFSFSEDEFDDYGPRS